VRSYVPNFELVNAAGFEDALGWLAREEGWRPLAGGTDAMVLLNSGKLPWNRFVSIRHLPELCQISSAPDGIEIGAAVTYSQIRKSEALARDFPLLCQAASWTGSIANQNRGTLGGNIVNASPAADSAPALLVYDAVLKLVSARGERLVPYSEFHRGYKEMRLEPDELIAEIHLPMRRERWNTYSRKVGTRRAQAISKVCIAAAAQIEDKTVRDFRLAFASVAPIPLRGFETEKVVRGQVLTRELVDFAKRTLAGEIAPIDDIRSSGKYRLTVAANLLGEFLGSLL
jgi:CO/xanthine dehydrogenase FAD-binding subunit